MRRRLPPARVVSQWPTCSGIKIAGIAMGRSQRLGNFRTRAEAGVDQSVGLELVERCRIVAKPAGLDDRRRVPIDAQPFEVRLDCRYKFRLAAAGIEIFNPDQKSSAAGAGVRMADNRRESVPQMKLTRGGGGETCDLQDSLHAKGDRGDS